MPCINERHDGGDWCRMTRQRRYEITDRYTAGFDHDAHQDRLYVVVDRPVLSDAIGIDARVFRIKFMKER
ncbi:hypothetical protein [Devosia sp. Leaf64]|uniref:hypothetical protein n=1 Tax=Devosia sp. Leaf64 TaxID=1736229 RepID=UPI0012E0FD63|nr:hypothetical protein [Devosia sp. Leaf64]